MPLYVTEVTYIDQYQLRLTLNDGFVRNVDLRDELYGEVFEPLADLEFFKQVKVNRETNTIERPNGADFAPEFLYAQGEPADMAAGHEMLVAV